MASSPWIYDSSAPTEEISVDNLNFTFHSEAAKPAFKDLSCDLDVYFGDLSYRLTAFGMLRFPDQIRSTSPDPICTSDPAPASTLIGSAESTPPSGDLAPASSSSAPSQEETTPPEDDVYCSDCDAYHTAEPESPLAAIVARYAVNDHAFAPAPVFCAMTQSNPSGSNHDGENNMAERGGAPGHPRHPGGHGRQPGPP